MEIVLDDYMKALCNLTDFVGDCIVKCKKDYLFIDFIVGKKFKKFNKQFCKRNNIDIKFDRLNKIILKMTKNEDEDYKDYIDYVITTDYYPENFTVFELDCLTRCCMLLMYLKEKDIRSLFLINVDFYFINDKEDLRWTYSTNINKIDTIIIQNHDIKILHRNIEYRTFSYTKCYKE